jgi:HK97 family phage prohead protease
VAEILRYERWWPLEDIEISRAHTDGRTVEAYAAVFNHPYEVKDQHGHYMEVVERSAFNKTLKDGGISRVMCLYNHGLTVHGSPSDTWSVPIGTPLEITPDSKGLKTITRYNRGPEIDRILEAIDNGAIRSQSFRGKIVRSTPTQIPRGRTGNLPTVTRHELGLSDYGPTPVPVNAAAAILAVRSRVTDLFAALRPSTTPQEPETYPVTSTMDADAEEPPNGHSDRDYYLARAQARMWLARKEAPRG